MKNRHEGAPPAGRAGRLFRRFRRLLLVFCLLGAAVTWLVQHHVVAAARPFVHPAGDVPAADCILVPGARIHPDGTPYSMLVDRLTIALELYRHGKAARVVVSGRGGGGVAVDEVRSMRRWLEERGVPSAAILDDPEGLRTIDSVRRCKEVFGQRSAIVVSNPFHVPRAVFLARSFGLEAYGVKAPALTDYSASTLWRNRGREVLARVRACLDVYLGGG